MTLSPSSLYNMLYDMNNLNPINQSLQPTPPSDERSPKRRSIFTVSSNPPFPSPTCNGTGTERQDLLNITEQLSIVLKNEHDHTYPTNGEHFNDDDASNDQQSPLSSVSSVSLPNNFDAPSSILTPPQSPKSQSSLNQSKTYSLSSSSSMESNVTTQTESSGQPQPQGKMERRGSKTHRSSKLHRTQRTKDRKSNQEKGKDCEDDGETGKIKCFAGKKSPAVISIEFCEDSSPPLCSQDRKNTMVYKASTAFAMGAVRKLSLQVSKLEHDHQLKIEESAARFILHSLLLNSWRQSRKQNDKLVKENQNHQRAVENMCLQLRVIRQMHREEKEKCLSRSVEVSGQSIVITNLKKERDKIQSELEKVENELNNCQVFVDTLRNQNMELIMSKNELQIVIGQLELDKQEEINRRIKAESEVLKTQQISKEIREQLYEVTRQKTKWQEEARGQESLVMSLKTDLAHSDKKLINVQNSYNELQREVKLFQDYKKTIQDESYRLKDQLTESMDHIQELAESVKSAETAYKKEQKSTEDLQRLLDEKETQMVQTRQDLSLFLQACVNKRRRWANSLHYLVFPLDIFRLIFDSPGDKQSRVHHENITF